MQDILVLIRILYSDGEIFFNSGNIRYCTTISHCQLPQIGMKLYTISAILEERNVRNSQALNIKDAELFIDFEETKRILEQSIKNEN